MPHVPRIADRPFVGGRGESAARRRKHRHLPRERSREAYAAMEVGSKSELTHMLRSIARRIRRHLNDPLWRCGRGGYAVRDHRRQQQYWAPTLAREQHRRVAVGVYRFAKYAGGFEVIRRLAHQLPRRQGLRPLDLFQAAPRPSTKACLYSEALFGWRRSPPIVSSPAPDRSARATSTPTHFQARRGRLSFRRAMDRGRRHHA